MTVDNVHWFLDIFDELEITVWIDGGWGVDALLGECTRAHEDLDIIIPEADSAKLTEVLAGAGDALAALRVPRCAGALSRRDVSRQRGTVEEVLAPSMGRGV